MGTGQRDRADGGEPDGGRDGDADARRPPERSRADAEARLDVAGRALSTAAVMYHSEVAALGGLSATDLRALDLLDRFGPLTAGALAQRSGLTPASVTALVRRLVDRGYARRTENPDDRRSVLVDLERSRMEQDADVFDDLVARLRAVYADYDAGQLALVAEVLERLAAAQRDATAHLGERRRPRRDGAREGF